MSNINVFTVAPIIAGGLLFLLFVTKVWRHEKILFGTILCMAICYSLVSYGFVMLATYISVSYLCLAVIYALVRRLRFFKRL